MLRSTVMAGVIALSCVGISQPADARVFVGFGFGFPGFWGYPYPYYPAYAYPPYPYYYPPYPAYPAAYPAPAAPPARAGANLGATSAFNRVTVREVQDELARQGYDVGPVDGRLGPQTRAAIRAYERDNGLRVDGLPSRSLREHMQAQRAG